VAPEARTAYAHYPLSYHMRPVMTVPYRIAYRVVQLLPHRHIAHVRADRDADEGVFWRRVAI
jgi:hypothetical protein